MARLAAVMVIVLTASACLPPSPADHGHGTGRDNGHGPSHGKGRGGDFVGRARFRDRQDDYLKFATQVLDPGSILNVLAHAERAERDRRFTWDADAVTVEGFADELSDMRNWKDTSDFDALYFVNLLYGYEGQLPPAVVAEIDDALLGFEYWFTEPTPDGIVDEKYYWSENHRIIFHTIEYLVGQRHPDDVFRNDGRTGREHMVEARGRIIDWLDEKADLGFTEWHSDVYYQKDVTPLLTLVEWADGDDELTTRASMVLDLVLFDVALHLHDGNLGATHGRSYMKDKSKAADQDTFHLAKLLFDDTELDYLSRGEAGATLLSRAQRYRLPAVIRRVARSKKPMVDRERMGVPLDITVPVTPDPEAPYGYGFDDPENVDFWWERGAQPAWQTVDITIDAIDTYDLWDTPTFEQFKPLRDAVGDDRDAARTLLQSLSRTLSFALLNEANTVTYRDRDVMLSTVNDFRPGTYSDQHHVWQATLSEDAVVFTTLPKNEPFVGADGWPDADGYWTGSGALPRSAQHGRTSVSLYAPRVPNEFVLGGFTRLDYTHAWFPTERFDEVVRAGNWTFGREGDGYVALWSHRPVEWRTYAPGEVFTDGLTEPFDLVAPGGPDNVWISHVGSRRLDGSFESFVADLTARVPEVDVRAPTAEGFPGGFDVAFDSPSEGVVSIGQDGAFTVAGAEVPLRNELRYDNPWSTTPFRSPVVEIGDSSGRLVLDFGANERRSSRRRR